ncbi:TPA: hemagglutinin repeat-containing protein, partial [Neisseria meningitidis]
MNRTLYKVVFNKHRNCMIAVAENAKREGKNTADTQAVGILPNDIAGFAGFIHSISVISFSLSLLLGSALILTSSSATAQGIVADKSAPAQQQPTILQTGNGIPQVNIQTPTSAGVSVNQYAQFDVGNRGAILNNSRSNTQTQLGGWIQGNPWLARGEARVVVNQINSSHSSQLNGYIEVGGRRAEVVIANPAGIAVNGGGFINASRATLTTGQPQYQAGDLSGFKIRQGNVVIAGHGLDARDTDYTRILSYHSKIDAPVWGQDVRVVAGQNDVAATGDAHSPILNNAAANTSNNTANNGTHIPLFAIDTGKLGGMYANKITLISTVEQAGIRNQGQWFASAGNVAVNAEGKLVNTGMIAATGENHAVSLHARNVHNSGTVASQDDANIHSQTLDNSGTVLSSGRLTVRNLGRLKNQNNGTIQAARLDMSTGGLDNTGNITQTGSQALDLVSAGKFDNSGKIGVSDVPQTGLNPNPSVIPQIPSTATGSGSSTVSVSKPGSNNPVSPTAPAKNYAVGRIQTTGAFDNAGSINAGGQIDIAAQNGLGNSGSLNAAKLRVSGDSFNNTVKGKLQAHDLAVNTQTAKNSGHLLTQTGKIDNRELHNAGEIAANNLTLIHSGRLSNDKKGNIRAAHLQLDTAGLHNAGNILADSGTVTTKNNLRNTGKVSVARLNTEGQTLDNTHGHIEAETVNIQSQQLTNQSGHITATEQLTINSRNVDNQNGKLLSANQAQLAVSDGLYNQHGEIATNRQLSIHDKNQNTLALNNADGTIQSAGNVSLQAKSLANNGTLTAGNKLDIALTDDFVVERDLTAGKQLNLSIKGRLKNTHTLQAGHTLKLNAGNIDNQVTGKIIGGEQTDITSEQHVDNRGLINSDGLTHIGAGQTLTNTGTGKIYGNHIALDAQILLNREETTEGSTKAGAIAARKRLDIGAKEIHNQEGALLSSEGIFAVGNRLDEQHHAAGMADTFVNGSAGLEVQGDALMSVRNMQNINNHFKTETYLAKAEKQVRDYTVLGQNTYYQAGKDGLFDNSQGQKDQTTATFHLKNGSRIEANQWHVRDYHIETYKERIIENRPAHITVGGDLTASGQNWLNKDSRIVVGGRIITDDLNQKEITNQSTTGKGRTDAVGTQWDSVTKKGWYSGRKRQRRTERNHTPYHDTQLFTHDFDTPVSVIQQNAASPSFQPAASAIKLIDGVSTAAVNGQRIHTGNVVSLNNATVTLPNSSLYTTHPDNKGWLVETDPQFADYRRWLGSDYMLQQLQLDTNHLHKRLGDGYYEQKLVNEQIHQLTGYRRLDGYRSDEEQFKALMDNGLTAAKTFGLTPGIALSAEQVARLTSDIVWMENQTVTLSDGSTQTVLVPKVYALARKGDLNTSGGLISAEQVLLKLQNGNLTNSGTIAGRQAVLIQARNINSNGNIQADQIGLKAEKSINIDGGQVQAGRLLTAQAQNINLNGTTQTSGNERNGNTAIDRMAGINVVGSHTEQVDNRTSDGILSLHASNDINLNAATVSNQVKDGTTQITAGNNLNLGTIRTEHREAYGTLDDENHRHVRQSTEVGSSIRTQNGALLRAGNDLKIRQGELEAEEGKTVLAAGRDVTISEGRQITELDTSVSGKSKGILSSTKTQDRYRFSHDEAVGSNIGGGKMIVAAGQDINVRGSNLISDKGIVLKAGHDIDISTAHNRYTGNEYHESKKSGVMGTGGLGFTIGNLKTTDDTDRTNIVHIGSIIGSLNGDTVTVAGNRYRQTGSTVSSPEGRNTVTAKSIDVESANNQYATDYAHTQEQKGLTVALNVPVVQSAQNFIQAAQNVGKSKNKRVNAMAAANAAWQGYQAAQQMQQFAPSSSAGQGQNNNQSPSISVSITYGEQKSRNEQKRRYTEAAASQIIGKGQTTLAATGSGEQSNINITGSDVIGHAGTTLIADNHIRLQSAKQDGSEQSKNKSSGWNAGVAVKIGNGISFGITAGGNIGKGKEQGGSTTHRHTHVGSTTGKTTIRSGGDTTLKGAQLIGKGIQADTRNLHIESVQDTETSQSKQQNGNVQVTVGYGFSASGSYSQSKVKADHASVTEQSGIYAGEDGYQIKVGNHTDLKGGIITSGKSAEDKGKNLFQTATLTASDIQNHSRYEGRSFGIGGSFDLNGGWDGTVTDKQGRPTDRISLAAGYGSDSDSQSSITKSGINTRNIHITDEAGQLARTGRTAKETEARIYTGIDTETADQHTGRLKNSFDKDAVAKEINLQREVTKEFGRNAAQAVAAVADKLGNTQSYERYQEARTLLEAELQNTDSKAEKAAIRASLGQVNAYLAENQSRYDTWKEGGIGRSILHGAAGGLTTGSLGGILAGSGTSLAAPYLDKAAENLGPAGKAAVNALGGAVIGYAAGGNVGTAAVGANVDWNN